MDEQDSTPLVNQMIEHFRSLPPQDQQRVLAYSGKLRATLLGEAAPDPDMEHVLRAEQEISDRYGNALRQLAGL